MPKPKPIDDPQLYDKNIITELRSSCVKRPKSRITDLNRPKQARKWLEKVQKL